MRVKPKTSGAFGVILTRMDETAQRLRRLLDERHYGKSDAKIGREAGVDPQTVTRTLAGKTEPQYETAAKLADYCQVSVEYLMTGEGSPEPPPAGLPDLRAQLAQIQAVIDSMNEALDRQENDKRPHRPKPAGALGARKGTR